MSQECFDCEGDRTIRKCSSPTLTDVGYCKVPCGQCAEISFHPHRESGINSAIEELFDFSGIDSFYQIKNPETKKIIYAKTVSITKTMYRGTPAYYFQYEQLPLKK